MSLDVIIYLGDNEEKKASVEEALQSLDLTYKFLSENDLGETIIDLFEEKQTSTKTVQNRLGEDLMLFKEIEDEVIINLSKQLNLKGHNITRKAMLTEHNKNWTLYNLLLEIIEEHHYFNVRGELIQTIQEIMKKDPKDVSSDMQLLVLTAYESVQKETPIQDLEQLLISIREG